VLGHRDLAQPLAPYARDAGFTHVQLLPLMERPFYGSWGLPDHRLLRADRPLRRERDAPAQGLDRMWPWC
jgi:hypothetical protein